MRLWSLCSEGVQLSHAWNWREQFACKCCNGKPFGKISFGHQGQACILLFITVEFTTEAENIVLLFQQTIDKDHHILEGVTNCAGRSETRTRKVTYVPEEAHVCTLETEFLFVTRSTDWSQHLQTVRDKVNLLDIVSCSTHQSHHLYCQEQSACPSHQTQLPLDAAEIDVASVSAKVCGSMKLRRLCVVNRFTHWISKWIIPREQPSFHTKQREGLLAPFKHGARLDDGGNANVRKATEKKNIISHANSFFFRGCLCAKIFFCSFFWYKRAWWWFHLDNTQQNITKLSSPLPTWIQTYFQTISLQHNVQWISPNGFLKVEQLVSVSLSFFPSVWQSWINFFPNQERFTPLSPKGIKKWMAIWDCIPLQVINELLKPNKMLMAQIPSVLDKHISCQIIFETLMH